MAVVLELCYALSMTRVFRYLTHPEVVIDPDVPVPEWGLSEKGRQRTLAFRGSPLLRDTRSVISSAERKALETAEILAAAIEIEVIVRARSHENDRSATGFLAPAEFESVADAFFATPNISVRGWERAIDAQQRIVSEADQVMRQSAGGDMLMVGHGGVGTLLYCHLAGLDIDRKHDQGAGGGKVFAFDLDRKSILHAWLPMEALDAPPETEAR